jgi:hypothetical protein
MVTHPFNIFKVKLLQNPSTDGECEGVLSNISREPEVLLRPTETIRLTQRTNRVQDLLLTRQDGKRFLCDTLHLVFPIDNFPEVRNELRIIMKLDEFFIHISLCFPQKKIMKRKLNVSDLTRDRTEIGGFKVLSAAITP